MVSLGMSLGGLNQGSNRRLFQRDMALCDGSIYLMEGHACQGSGMRLWDIQGFFQIRGAGLHNQFPQFVLFDSHCHTTTIIVAESTFEAVVCTNM